MGTEIERKFLVMGESWRESSAGVPYRQGYLNTHKERVVRVRTMGERAALTIKGVSVGASRLEFEYEIPLDDAGFQHHSKGDYFYTITAYHDQKTIEEKLHLLGRLTMMSKQLDMALTNDEVAKWYTEDFIVKLGLKRKSS